MKKEKKEKPPKKLKGEKKERITSKFIKAGSKESEQPVTPVEKISEKTYEEYIGLISLTLTNETDEKIHNVKIFNYDFKEQSQIKYENDMMAYSEFLRKWDKLESKKYTIQKIRLLAMCDYKKFEQRQLKAELYYKNKDIFGRELVSPVQTRLFHSPLQVHDNIIDIEKSYTILSISEFELEYLMPDTTVQVHFYITKNPQTQHGK
jgi:hypothetical protein